MIKFRKKSSIFVFFGEKDRRFRPNFRKKDAEKVHTPKKAWKNKNIRFYPVTIVSFIVIILVALVNKNAEISKKVSNLALLKVRRVPCAPCQRFGAGGNDLPVDGQSRAVTEPAGEKEGRLR